MGVKHGREYEEIMKDMGKLLEQIPTGYELFEMSYEDWQQMEQEERNECLKTLADDIFFGLGTDPEIELGLVKFVYENKSHRIIISFANKEVGVVSLI